jgi:cytochrome c553
MPGRVKILLTWLLVLAFGPRGVALADANAGAALVQQNGCQSCHGARFEGAPGYPALFGVEHRRSQAQIVDALLRPKAPMPNYGFTAAQAADIAAYLAGLDGGAGQPMVTIAPEHPSDYAIVTVRFPGPPPARVSAVASMAMGSQPMKSPEATFKPTSDPHVFQGKIEFSMAGSWTIHIDYDGKEIDNPIVVGQ